MPRCPNGSRRNPATGECEPTKTRNKTAKASPKARNKTVKASTPTYTFNEFCHIASELYGVSFTFFNKHGGDMRTLYYVYNKNRAQFVFPKDLKKIMIGTPADRFLTRTPYTGKAIKNKDGVSANVVLKDINRNDLHGTAVKDPYAQRYNAWEK
jgi:hypothetical protein